VARKLDRLMVAYGKPKSIVSDNGTGLSSSTRIASLGDLY
jgi:hypothetical protein